MKRKHIEIKVRVRVIVVMVLLLVLSVGMPALDSQKRLTQYGKQRWDKETGLPSNSVYAILQTTDGYLWLGTGSGLVRFDGVEFELFGAQFIKNDQVRALYQDPQGRLWIGTKGLGLFSLKDGQFNSYSSAPGRSLTGIQALSMDAAGTLWIGSVSETTGGLTAFHNGQFTTRSIQDSLLNNSVYSIYKDHQQDLWIATAKGIVKKKAGGGIETHPNWLGGTYSVCFNSRTQQLWFTSAKGNLNCWTAHTRTVYSQKDGIVPAIANCMLLDSDGNLWIGTDGGGLTRWNQQHFETLTSGEGLADSYVYALCEDREKNLWVGTLNNGLLQLRDQAFTGYGSQEGLPESDVQCLLARSSGAILIGTPQGLFQMENSRKLPIQAWRPEGAGPPKDFSVLSLCETPSGALWIGTDSGLYRYDMGQLDHFTHRENGLTEDSVDTLLCETSGIIWAGTNSGLNRLDETGPQPNITSFTRKNGLSSDKVTCMVAEKNSPNLLIGTVSGLNRLSLDQKIDPIKAFTGKNILFIHQESPSLFWVGTDNGLFCWQRKPERLRRYSQEQGLLDNHITSIQADQAGNLWLAGPKGVSRLARKELEEFDRGEIILLNPQVFEESDGLPSSYCNAAAIQTPDQGFLFATTKGIASIQPEQLKSPVLKVLIEKVVVDDRVIPVTGSTGGGESLTLDAGSQRIEFYYTGMSLTQSHRMQFKVKLEGYDPAPRDLGNTKSTTYTNLKPRKYTFWVRAANANGIWSPEQAAISFTLKPSFFQTPWFYVLSAFLVLALILLGHLLRVRNLKKQEKKLSHLVAIRTRDLQQRNIELEKAEAEIRLAKNQIEAKNQQLETQTSQLQQQAEKLTEMDHVKSRFFANISHEFRTPLTLIMGPLEQMLAEEPGEAQKKRILLMQRNSQRLLHLINQLLELSKFESGKVRLQALKQNVVPLLKGIVANFQPLAEQRELDLRFLPSEQEMVLFIDAEKLDHILGNLLINAIKCTPAGGCITLSAALAMDDDPLFPEGMLAITVSDTGPGIPREQLSGLFNRFYQTESAYERREKGAGIGLALVKELVQLHHGSIDVHSHEGRGTQFILHFPLGQTFFKPDEMITLPPLHSGESGFFPLPDWEETPHQEPCTPPLGQSPEENSKPVTDTVLIVDDSADVRTFVRGSLEPLYTVLEARDGEEGLDLATRFIPDLILCDIMMPRVDGLELCRRLKEEIKTSHIPVILLTAKAAEENIIRGLEIGADDYITKPFNTRILLARIKNLVELRHQRHLNISRQMTQQPLEIPLTPLDTQFMKQLKAIIHKNLANTELNVEQLARDLFLDRSTLYRKVLALTGETPLEFLHSSRLHHAAELLQKSNASIIEIALETGFASASYFTKCFKKKFLRNPSEVRDKGIPNP